MSYIEGWVIVDGALDEEDTFDTEEQFEAWRDGLIEQLSGETFPAGAEIYRLDHGHDRDFEECHCVQYLNDHHPVWSTR